MNPKPQPLYSPPPRKHCPVCGNVSYSVTGIHPQCAMDQADAVRMTKAKPRVKATTKTKVQAWQKICPKCRAFMHVRKKFCDCGHTFAGMSASGPSS